MFHLRQTNFIDRTISRLRYSECYRNSSLLPELGADARRLVEQLKRDGSIVLERFISPDDLRLMQSELQQALESLKFETPCLAQSRVDPARHADLIENQMYATTAELRTRGLVFERNEVESLEQAVRDFSPSTLTIYMLEHSATYRKIWLNPHLLGIVGHYLGMLPKLVEAYVRRNFPTSFRTMNHFWHRDLNNKHHLLKAFFFLSDCSLENGPHEFILGSHADYVLNDRRYYSDAQVDAIYPPGSPRRLVSEVKAGTVIIEDTRGLHRARMPERDSRDLGYAVFIPFSGNSKIKYYDFPRASYEQLSSFQQAFIPSACITEAADQVF